MVGYCKVTQEEINKVNFLVKLGSPIDLNVKNLYCLAEGNYVTILSETISVSDTEIEIAVRVHCEPNIIFSTPMGKVGGYRCGCMIEFAFTSDGLDSGRVLATTTSFAFSAS